jgi:hypothetical protein
MIRKCDGTDPNLVWLDQDSDKYVPCKCGLEFDDVDCMVVYPHFNFAESRDAVKKALQMYWDIPDPYNLGRMKREGFRS